MFSLLKKMPCKARYPQDVTRAYLAQLADILMRLYGIIAFLEQ
jgi:hypothetical protein